MLRDSPVHFSGGAQVALTNSESVNMICSFSRRKIFTIHQKLEH
jgi:hypothetical protein